MKNIKILSTEVTRTFHITNVFRKLIINSQMKTATDFLENGYLTCRNIELTFSPNRCFLTLDYIIICFIMDLNDYVIPTE